MTVSRPVFAIFQGGGAKGIAHLGAVAACEKSGMTFVGVAGASAGALMATLLSVGLRSDDLFNPKVVGDDILTRHGVTPIDLLGREDWEAVEKAKGRVDKLVRAKGLKRISAAFGALKSYPLLKPSLASKGLMSTDSVRDFLNKVLNERLSKLHAMTAGTTAPAGHVTFADLDYSRFKGELIPLKVIATNVSTRELWIFDRDLTPNVRVADAVAASIAIPGVFRPVEIVTDKGPQLFVDGGLVSNLPVWVFVNEKLAFERSQWREPPAPILGFTLRDKPTVEPTKGSTASSGGLGAYLMDVVQSGLSGSQGVSQRFVQDLTVVPLETELTMLGFDANRAEIASAYADGERCALRAFDHHLLRRPDMIRKLLGEIRTNARGRLRAMPGFRTKGWRLRANIVEKVSRDGYRVTYADGFGLDADDRLPLDDRGRAAPAAFVTREPRLTPVERKHSRPLEDYMTRYERAMVPGAIKSIISIPILEDALDFTKPSKDRGGACGVLSIDCSLPLDSAYADPGFMSWLIGQSTLFYPLINQEPRP